MDNSGANIIISWAKDSNPNVTYQITYYKTSVSGINNITIDLSGNSTYTINNNLEFNTNYTIFITSTVNGISSSYQTDVTTISCPEGSYCPIGSTSATACPAGSYCPNSSTITPCPIGTYNPLTGQTLSSACQICPAGSFCPVESPYNSSVAIPCQAGTYNPNTGQTSSIACLACPDNNTSVCPEGSSVIQGFG